MHSKEPEKFRERWVAVPNLITHWKNDNESKFELFDKADTE